MVTFLNPYPIYEVVNIGYTSVHRDTEETIESNAIISLLYIYRYDHVYPNLTVVDVVEITKNSPENNLVLCAWVAYVYTAHTRSDSSNRDIK